MEDKEINSISNTVIADIINTSWNIASTDITYTTAINYNVPIKHIWFDNNSNSINVTLDKAYKNENCKISINDNVINYKQFLLMKDITELKDQFEEIGEAYDNLCLLVKMRR